MPENSQYSVMALTSAIVADDTTSIEVTLAVVGQSPLVLTMSPGSLGQIVSGLTEVDMEVQDQIGSTTGHVAIHAADALDVVAQEAAGGDKVAISFQNSEGRLQSFALSLEQVEQLRADLEKAVARARQLAARSRN
jgi:hypothetical protein